MQMCGVIFKLCIKDENMIGLNLMTPTCGRSDCHEVRGNGGIKLRTPDSQGVAWAASQQYLEGHLVPRWQLLFAAECLSWYPEVAGIMLFLSA